MTPPERRSRSELARLVAQRGLLRGTLQERRRSCGKPNCKCSRGQPHVSLYLVYSQDGRLRQRYVPKTWEPTVRQWVADYQRARELMEEISRRYHEKVQQRQD